MLLAEQNVPQKYIALGVVGVVLVNVSRLLFRVAVKVRTGGQIHGPQCKTRLDMGGVKFHRLAHLLEGVGVLSLFHIGVRQLVMSVGVLGVDLQAS